MNESNVEATLLKKKYDLHNELEVEVAAKRTETLTGERLPKDPSSRIGNYLARFRKIIERPEPAARERGIDAIKQVILDKFVTKYEDIPESYWKTQESILRERGQAGDWNSLSDKDKEFAKRENVKAVLNDQEASLEQWVDYMASSDSSYMSDYLKYWVFRSVISLSEYDKDKNEFPKRSKGTVKQFPDINHEALSYVIDAVHKKHRGEIIEFKHDIQPEERAEFEKHLASENFAKLYGWAVELINPIPEHLLPITAGEWKKYDRGSDHRILAKSLRGKGTGWCTAGEGTARNQLAEGDFYVYYSLDEDQNPTVPRIAIRMEEDGIAEVRGVAHKQNLDPYMGGVLAEKLEEFPDKDQYLKKENDMKQLTAIENKMKAGQELNRDELVFLYEVDNKIQGFGYEKDPRIKELLKIRDVTSDVSIVFNLPREQVAHAPDEINPDTKIYVGKLELGIFQRLLDVEHIYTYFPESDLWCGKITIGGETEQQLEEQLKDRGFKINTIAAKIIKSPNFTTLSDTEDVRLVSLTVNDMGLNDGSSTEEIYRRAQELGLEICPAEVGPHLVMSPEWPYKRVTIGMKPIALPDGNSLMFSIHHIGIDQTLADSDPADDWHSWSRFVFCLPKKH